MLSARDMNINKTTVPDLKGCSLIGETNTLKDKAPERRPVGQAWGRGYPVS